MKVSVFRCGPAINQSETKALEFLWKALESAGGHGEWVLLSHLAFSVTHQLQSEAVDLVAIGPPGVRVLEVKHWLPSWMAEHKGRVEEEADRVANQARRLGTTLRKVVAELPRIEGVILLTPEPSKLAELRDRVVRGVPLYTLNEWKEAVGIGGKRILAGQCVAKLARWLAPNCGEASGGPLRRLAGYTNLALQTPGEEQFHRVYRGVHPVRQDRVLLHLYDLSASDEKGAENRARREFEALQRVQRHSWAPRILDSFQEVAGYAGEMYFFTVVDPAAPTLAERAADETWEPEGRLAFACRALGALAEFHAGGAEREPLVHRNLTRHTILVKHDNSPILTGFAYARIPSGVTVGSGALPRDAEHATVAPEVRREGLGAADQRSDVYSLCACLESLFEGRDERQSHRALEILNKGKTADPEHRLTLAELERELSELLGCSGLRVWPPPARYWTEEQVVGFRGRRYRIVARLGSGGQGTAFKVVELDRSSNEELGTYVAKVVHDPARGEQILRAYSLARPHLARHPGLSAILEVARQWCENEFVALLSWIEGTPLAGFAGVFPLLAEEFGESAEALAGRWLARACEALGVLHRSGLIHGDVSPRNMIVSGGELVLTDYDCVTRIAEPLAAPGTLLYGSPSYGQGRPASPSDDIYALAASFFHVLFDREPFQYGGQVAKNRGLNWEGVDRASWAGLADFLDRATHPDPGSRFVSVEEALAAIGVTASGGAAGEGTRGETIPPRSMSRGPLVAAGGRAAAPVSGPVEGQVPWLLQLLQSYPGSCRGNSETRGLDTGFAAETYVPTPLEEALERDIRQRRVRLVILCGNAGDGKTALLQHLAERLGLGRHTSADRVIQGKLSNGLRVQMNLDGSAAWRGRSSDKLLDEFLEPFQDGGLGKGVVGLLAINDGRLLEWMARSEDRQGETALTRALYALVDDEPVPDQPHLRFISLNRRSLVGSVATGGTEIETPFLDRLVDQLYGGPKAAEIWSPCQSCLANKHCEVLRAARVFGPRGIPGLLQDSARARARKQLFQALQAVHLRGETHITMRELRAALVYVLFGLHWCDDYCRGARGKPLPYWDRAFAPDSPARQGELLRELARLDPALESHPQIDRYLVAKRSPDSEQTAPHYPDLLLASARRRAYFEWTEEDLRQVAGDPQALGLARGQYLDRFRRLAVMSEKERAEECHRLCRGISRLEHLPFQALDREDVVPLRITPRTPTETAFWVEKPLSAFRLEPDLPPEAEGLDRLHRQAWLIYRYRDGTEERLRLGAELFHLLCELSEGYQLGDVASDDTFANLSIFVQRLVREDERELFAWNPMQEHVIYKVSSELGQTEHGPRQRVILKPISGV